MWKVQMLNGQVYSSSEIKWEKLPNDFIDKFKLYLPNKKCVVMSGFESYLYLKEIYQFFNSKNYIIDTINVLGKHKKNVYQFSYNITQNHAIQTQNIWGKEFSPLIFNKTWNIGIARKTNHLLWHKGILFTPKVKIVST